MLLPEIYFENSAMQVLKGYRMAFFAKLLPKTASTDVRSLSFFEEELMLVQSNRKIINNFESKNMEYAWSLEAMLSGRGDGQ